MAKYCCWMLWVVIVCVSSVTRAVPPSETLLPDTAKVYVSVPDVELLRAQWNTTQLGHLVNDPMMKPFVEDLKEQVKSKLSTTRVRLGLTLDDLDNLYGGELSLAVIQPDNDPQQHAMALLLDVTGHQEQAKAMLDKVFQNLRAQGATSRTEKIRAVDVTVFTMPKKQLDSPLTHAWIVLHEDLLLATDHAAVCAFVLGRVQGEGKGTLAERPAYRATMDRCARASGDVTPHVRWFVEPLGYAQVVRAAAAANGPKRRGASLVDVLSRQGFDAVQGIGGQVLVATGDQEFLHRSMVYAPAVQRPAGSANQEKYNLAARMLDFPNTDQLQPQPWVSRDLGTYLTFNWKMIEAFEHSKTLVNELLLGTAKDKEKDTDMLEQIIVSLAEDKDGPQVDLRRDLLHHFAERATMVSDCRRPITPESERLMFAIELTNPEAVQRTMDKAFAADPYAERREFHGHVVWEYITDDAPVAVEALRIEGAGFDPFGAGLHDEPEDSEEEEKILPNFASTVLHGHLLVASHVDILVETLERPLGTDLLADSGDFLHVEDALAKIGAGPSSFRFFSRTDEAYRPTYELIRQGQMPEAKTVLGRLLNRLLGPDEKGILREQQIDGTKMPEFDAVRRYLGPAGVFVQSEEDGWFVAGCLLSKDGE